MKFAKEIGKIDDLQRKLENIYNKYKEYFCSVDIKENGNVSKTQIGLGFWVVIIKHSKEIKFWYIGKTLITLMNNFSFDFHDDSMILCYERMIWQGVPFSQTSSRLRYSLLVEIKTLPIDSRLVIA